MPISFNRSGTLDIRPRSVVVEQDPYELAIKQAQLKSLQADPAFRDRQLTLQQLGLEQNQENDEALRRIQEAGLLEQMRSNSAREETDKGQLGETIRSNVSRENVDYGQLQETIRSNTAREGSGREVNRTSVINTLANNLLNDPTEKGQAIAAKTLAALGYPELESVLGETQTQQTNPKTDGYVDEVTGKVKPKPTTSVLKPKTKGDLLDFAITPPLYALRKLMYGR